MFDQPQQLQLTGQDGAASARRMVRACLADSRCPELSDDAELLTSEVVTNALLHAYMPMWVIVTPLGAGVRVEVADGSPRVPTLAEYGELATSGRGVRLLDLLARWGVDATPGGKLVWFELGETRGDAA